MLAYARRRRGAAAVAGLVALFLVVVPLLRRGGDGDALRGSAARGDWRFLTIVDAGSSGCRAHVFRWRSGARKHVEVDPTHASLKVKPGLSTFERDPDGAGASLKPLLDFVLSEIPEASWARSPIFLKATAGLRMVPEGPRERILDSVRDALAASPLKFDDREGGARVIAGTDEGGYGWMSVNYLLGHLDGRAAPGDYVGVVEMGGASAQVTQIATGATPSGYGFDFRMGGAHYALYTHSYLGYGLEQARETLSHALAKKGGREVRDPCLNVGFDRGATRADVYDGPEGVAVRGVGADARECRRAVEKALFARDDPCDFGSCSFNNVYQPASLPSSKLLVFENFYYTAKMIGAPAAPGDAAPRDFDAAAGAVCARSWADLLASDLPKSGEPKNELNKLCFSATYLALFLEKGVGVAPDAPVKLMQQVGDHGIDWSLGAAIKEASTIAHAEP